ncbi:cell adhesion molecule 2-like [Strongylocentrotus purpuratus]|uniref:Ig-like domain-containing protein n=1 Tax=Strongylocentrotus purpuratus TaxID=7668 RepID=A0A7M7P3X2_STRPU|nr:cell adhesion molecule 2-like [Strongylocentrotus purpuratus]
MAGIAFAVLCLVAFSEATVFVDDPDNLTVEVGDQATFRCDFNQDYDCSVSQWLYSSSQCTRGSFVTIATCRSVSLVPSIDTSRFSSTFDKSTTLLQINDVQLSDAGNYACRISHLNEFSRCGHLTVVEPPTPQCTMLSSSVRVGDTVRLTCRVPEEALTRTKLTWYPPETPGSTCSLKIDPGQSYTIERVLQESDKFRVFTCIAGNDINNGPNCNLYPFEIKTVSVRFQQEKSGEKSALKFECVADAALSDTRYSWSVRVVEFPNGTQPEWIDASTDDRFVIVGDQTRFLLLIPGQDDDGLQVRCTAYSAIGTSKTSKVLTIIPFPDDHFVTNSTSGGDEDSHEPPYLWIGIGGLSVTSVGGLLIICFMCTRRSVLGNQEDSGTRDGGVQDLSIVLDDGYEIPRLDANRGPTANSEYMEMNAAR